MASSSRSSEEANKIQEDLVLSWTRDEATSKMFATFLGNDRQLLQELIQCVHKGKDANGTKQKLSTLLGTGKDRKSFVIRARVLARLISIALGLHPDDITIDSHTGKESLRPSMDFKTTLHARLAKALQDDSSVLSYLFKDALEADDEVMTVIFCDRRFFEMYPVPYFHGCDLAVVQETSKLWLSQEFGRGFYYSTVLEPLFKRVRADQLKREDTPPKILVKNTLKAMTMLCELLQRRTVKAGARLLEIMLSFRNETTDRVRKLVKELVFPLVRFKNGTGNGKFKGCFFGDFENLTREGRRHSRGSDQVRGRNGQYITVGPSSAQTDSNLLCWAARRGYFNLIWCISLGYTKARPKSPSENLLEDATEALAVSLLWKVALWCATRHGQDSVVMELTRPKWVKQSIDFNDYSGIQGCLPPLHLVSLLGDTALLRVLGMGAVGIQFGAHKTDYLGKTPLDYAMQFQLRSKISKKEMEFQVITNNIKDRMQLRPIAIYYTTKSQQNQYSLKYKGTMSMPPPGHQSCIQELLQMPEVIGRLKELNDMYTTQANFVLVGAALIASVAFGGWLQPPLGYIDYFQFVPPSPSAPEGTYEQYVAVEGHLTVQMFVAFNALSFFLGISTMLIGAKATLFVHDNYERTIALMKVQKTIKWMLGFFITSMVCIMAAFICAGLAILPPIQRLEWSMIVSLCLGGCIYLITLIWILFSLARDQIVKLKDWMVKFILPFDKEKKLDVSYDNLCGSLVNEEDMKTLYDEMEQKITPSSQMDSLSSDATMYFYELPKGFSYDTDGLLDDGPLMYGRSIISMY